MPDCFKKSNSANDTVDKICIVYGNGATTITIIRNWFKRFRTDNFELKDENHNSCPAKMNMDLIKVTLIENPRYSMQEIVDIINISLTGKR